MLPIGINISCFLVNFHIYSYFVACTRAYLGKGFSQKEALLRATEECIEKGILEDVLRKHRAEVVDMFLTKFDKKMFYESLRDEGREEMAQKYEALSKDHEELSKDHEELSKDHEELSKDHEELSRKHEALIKDHARRLYETGIPYDVACKIIKELDGEELKKIYEMK